MKHKYEDELAKLAFGDLTGSEAERARQIADADPKAAEVLSSYRDMAAGLRRMPVPEHQLSTERLRNVILDQNLKPRRRQFTIFKWLSAPIAIGAAAFLLTIALHAGNKPNPITAFIGDNSPSVIPDSAKPLVLRNLKPTEEHAVPGSGAHEGGSVQPNNETRVASNSNRSSGFSETTPPSILTSRGNGGMRGIQPTDRGSLRTSAPPESIAMNVESAVVDTALAFDTRPNPSSPIILIGSDTDSNTGANRATEVSSANNVVVGG